MKEVERKIPKSILENLTLPAGMAVLALFLLNFLLSKILQDTKFKLNFQVSAIMLLITPILLKPTIGVFSALFGKLGKPISIGIFCLYLGAFLSLFLSVNTELISSLEFSILLISPIFIQIFFSTENLKTNNTFFSYLFIPFVFLASVFHSKTNLSLTQLVWIASALAIGVHFLKWNKLITLTLNVVGSSLMISWFFRNLAIQLGYSHPNLSISLNLFGGALGLLAMLACFFFLLKKQTERLELIKTFSISIFLLSFLCDLSFPTIFGIPFDHLDEHMWFRINHGIREYADISRPFLDYFPADGALIQSEIPRFLFVKLDFSLADFFTFNFFIGFISHLLFIFLIQEILKAFWNINRINGFLVAALLAITNFCSLQIYHPHHYGWVVLERLQLGLLSILAVIYLCRGIRSSSVYLTLGLIHGVSLLYEVSSGVAGTLGLMILIIISFERKSLKSLWTVVGLATPGLLYSFLFNIPVLRMAVDYPTALLDMGKKFVDPNSKHNVFEVFQRLNFQFSFHHWFSILTLVTALCLISSGRPKNHKFYLVFVYLFVASFANYISRGCKLFDIEMAPAVQLIQHSSMNSIYIWPLFLITVFFLFERQILENKNLPVYFSILLFSLNGFITSSMRVTIREEIKSDHIKSENFYRFPYKENVEISFISVVDYFYKYKSGKNKNSDSSFDQRYFLPASKWKENGILDLPKFNRSFVWDPLERPSKYLMQPRRDVPL